MIEGTCMPKKKTSVPNEQAARPPAKRVGTTAATGRQASMSNPHMSANPDTQEGKAEAEQKQPTQVISVEEAFNLTLEQYDEVFKRLA